MKKHAGDDALHAFAKEQAAALLGVLKVREDEMCTGCALHSIIAELVSFHLIGVKALTKEGIDGEEVAENMNDIMHLAMDISETFFEEQGRVH